MLLSWVTPVIKKGYKKPLELSDLGKLAKSDSAALNYERLHKFWSQEVKEKGLENASIGKVILRSARTRVIAGAMMFLISLLFSFVGPVCRLHANHGLKYTIYVFKLKLHSRALFFCESNTEIKFGIFRLTSREPKVK